MIKKLKTRRGTTVAEMLVAVVLLALLTVGGVTVSAAVMASYNRMKEAANADILASTVIEAISNEIRLAQGALEVTTDNTLTLNSALYGEGAVLRLATDDTGRLVAYQTAGVAHETEKQLLPEDAYNGLHLAELEFKEITPAAAPAAPAAGAGRTAYSISFTVCNSAGQVLWKDATAAAPMQ